MSREKVFIFPERRISVFFRKVAKKRGVSKISFPGYFFPGRSKWPMGDDGLLFQFGQEVADTDFGEFLRRVESVVPDHAGVVPHARPEPVDRP